METVDKLIGVSAWAQMEILRTSYMMAFNTTTLEVKNIFGGHNSKLDTGHIRISELETSKQDGKWNRVEEAGQNIWELWTKYRRFKTSVMGNP